MSNNRTMTLTDFLSARIAEDETAAKGAYRDSVDDAGVCHEHWRDAATAVMWGDLTAISGLEADYLSNHIARHDPARALAEAAAKRAIIESVDALTNGEKAYLQRLAHTDREDARYQIARDILLFLALPYVDHPDFRDEWRLAANANLPQSEGS